MAGRAVEVKMAGLKARMTQKRRAFKDSINQQSIDLAEHGERMMKQMVPRNTGALEDSIKGTVGVDTDGIIRIRIGTNSNTLVNSTPIKIYAVYMDEGFTSRTGNPFYPYKLGKNSLAKQGGVYKVGWEFTIRTQTNLRRKYKKQFLKAAQDVGFSNAKWRSRR